MREAVYIPEFKQLSTAVNTTAFMMSSGVGNPHLGERGHERGGGQALVVPRQDRRQQEMGADEEDRNPHDHRVCGFRHRPFRVRRLAAAIVAISAPTIEKMTVTMPTVIAPKPSGMNPPWAHRLEKSIDLFGHKPRTNSDPSAMNTQIAATLMPANQNSNSPKDDTRTGWCCHQDHQDQRGEQRDVDPVLDDLRARDRLEADDDHPEIPVQPSDREAGPVAQRVAGIVGERSCRRVGHRHLGQHAYDHDDQHPGQRVGDEGAWPGITDDDARADEQARADNAADSDHRPLPLT